MDVEKEPPDRGPPPDDHDVIMEGTPTSMAQKRFRDNEDNPGLSKAKKTSPDSNLPAASIQTTFIHPMLSEENKAYSESDSGPFIVHVQKEEESNSGFSIRPIKFGQLLFKNNIKNIARDGIKRIGRNRVSVEFTSARDANNFVKNPLPKISTKPTYPHIISVEWVLSGEFPLTLEWMSSWTPLWCRLVTVSFLNQDD